MALATKKLRLSSVSKLITACVFIGASLSSCSAPSVSPALESETSARTVAWLVDKYGTVNSRGANRLVNQVAQRISAGVYASALERKLDHSVAERFRSYSWQVIVINDQRANAFSVGAGNIVLTLGMLRETRTEAELAAVISHEMAHQLLGHIPQAIAEQGLTAPAPGFAYSLPYELDADTLGLKLMHVARYDLRYAAEALSIGYRQIDGLVAGIPEKWLSTRMANLEQQIASYGSYLPATTTTRKFNRMRRQLLTS